MVLSNPALVRELFSRVISAIRVAMCDLWGVQRFLCSANPEKRDRAEAGCCRSMHSRICKHCFAQHVTLQSSGVSSKLLIAVK